MDNGTTSLARLHGRARKVDPERASLVSACKRFPLMHWRLVDVPDRSSFRVEINGRVFEVRIREKFS